MSWAVCLLLLAGCRQMVKPNVDYSLRPAEKPTIGLQYFPYGRALDRHIARPVPDYRGWPDERMLKDFSRLAELRLDFVLLAMTPEDVTDAHRRQRYEQFFAMRRSHPEWPKIGIWVERTAEFNTADTNAYVRWLTTLFARNPDLFYTFGRRVVVVLSPDFGTWPVYHPALALQYTTPRRNGWLWQPLSPDDMREQSFPASFAVFAGWVGDQTARPADKWKLRRHSGKTLIYALRRAVAARPERLCIASWNDFRNGSFIEPNTLDGAQPYDALVREMRRFHGLPNAR